MTKRSSVSNDVDGWLASTGADRLADYAARGRKHQNMTIEELTAGWVHAFRSMADNVRDPERGAIEQDFNSEFSLRGSEPPYNLVRAEFERFMAEFDRANEIWKLKTPRDLKKWAKKLIAISKRSNPSETERRVRFMRHPLGPRRSAAGALFPLGAAVRHQRLS